MDNQAIIELLAKNGVHIETLVTGDQVKGDKHEYQAGAQVTQHFHGADDPSAADADEPLADYIYDRNLLRRVIRAAERCTSTAEFNDTVVTLLRNSRQMEESTLHTKTFLKLFLPHMKSIDPKPSVEALQKNIRRKS